MKLFDYVENIQGNIKFLEAQIERKKIELDVETQELNRILNHAYENAKLKRTTSTDKILREYVSATINRPISTDINQLVLNLKNDLDQYKKDIFNSEIKEIINE